MKKIALLIMMFIFLTCKTACGQADSLQDHSIAGADRDDFITVSMLVASPQRALYSVFGHAVLRLQSPSNNLDYVFTFESQPNMGTFITGVLGKARAHYVAVPAEQYIDDMRKDNRELWQYKLNLKPQEKQELWRILDSELQSGDYRYFNILYTNCLTTSVVNLQRSLMNEHVEWGEPIFPMMLSNGEFLRYTLRNSKWTEFLFVTFGGLAYGRHTPNESRLIPEVIIPMLRQAKIVENETGKSRPVITDKGKRLVKGIKDRPLAVSPMMVFGLLLLIALMVTACECSPAFGTGIMWYSCLCRCCYGTCLAERAAKRHRNANTRPCVAGWHIALCWCSSWQQRLCCQCSTCPISLLQLHWPLGALAII